MFLGSIGIAMGTVKILGKESQVRDAESLGSLQQSSLVPCVFHVYLGHRQPSRQPRPPPILLSTWFETGRSQVIG